MLCVSAINGCAVLYHTLITMSIFNSLPMGAMLVPDHYNIAVWALYEHIEGIDK